jgi:hypothetical protein
MARKIQILVGQPELKDFITYLDANTLLKLTFGNCYKISYVKSRTRST